MNRPYVSLQPSEAVLVQAASQIFSAYISTGQCTPDNEDEYLKKAIKQTVRMARIIDESVQSDKEL